MSKQKPKKREQREERGMSRNYVNFFSGNYHCTDYTCRSKYQYASRRKWHYHTGTNSG